MHIKNTQISNLVIRNFFIPNLLLVIFSGSTTFILVKFNSLNVNLNFSYSIFWISSASLLFLIILLLVFLAINKDFPSLGVIRNKETIKEDSWLLLLALIPIIRYSIGNTNILSFFDFFLVLLLFLMISFALILLIPKFFEKYTSIRVLRSISAGYVFIIFNMASFSAMFYWHESGNFLIQFGLLISTILIIWLLYGMPKKERIFIVLIFFIGSTIISLIPLINLSKTQNTNDSFQDNKLLNLISSREIKKKPNIYLLLYDAYIPNDVLSNYDIDNYHQEQFLENEGFILYPDIYSIGSHTLSSMNKVLNVSLENYGHMRKGVSGDGIIQEILKDNNYETFGLFPWNYMFLGIEPSYDYFVPQETTLSSFRIVTLGIFYGEFRFDIGINFLLYDQFLNLKRELFNSPHKNSIFVYAHSGFPRHSQNSGACLSNEVDLFKDRLDSANIEMKQDVEIITKNDPEALIIIAGDHGPYLTKNCYHTQGRYSKTDITREDIQDRIATFLAVKWPTNDYYDYDEFHILQDIFPVVLSYLYEDEQILEAKLEPELIDTFSISGVKVIDGIIYGGKNDGEFLFDQ